MAGGVVTYGFLTRQARLRPLRDVLGSGRAGKPVG
jgi:hypothetical protein